MKIPSDPPEFKGLGERGTETKAGRLERAANSPVEGSEVGTSALSGGNRKSVGKTDAEPPPTSRETSEGSIWRLNANSERADRLHRSPEMALVLGWPN